jgi:hypothetical protein
MERLPLKRRRSVVPVQKPDERVGKWDESGGVYTQENPRWNSQSGKEKNLEGESVLYMFIIMFLLVQFYTFVIRKS